MQQLIKNLEYDMFPILTVIVGSKHWSLKLLQIVPGVYWVQVNKQASLWASPLHVIAFQIMKQHSCIISKEEIIAVTEENSG